VAERRCTGLARAAQPVSLVALLATLVLLFGFQGEQILAQPLVIALLAVPILIQVYFNAGLAYLLNRFAGEQHCVAGPSALIGASNFFELAVAAAISLFGFNSGAALATVVGVLIEVPVMLSVVWIVNVGSRGAVVTLRRRAAAAAPAGDAGRGSAGPAGRGGARAAARLHAAGAAADGRRAADVARLFRHRPRAEGVIRPFQVKISTSHCG
jgi:hypothetical protein